MALLRHLARACQGLRLSASGPEGLRAFSAAPSVFDKL